LNIQRDGASLTNDERFEQLIFHSSSVSLVHRDIHAKFPNIEEIRLDPKSKLNNPEEFQNCQDIKRLTLSLKDLTGVSGDTFTDCKKLETLRMNIESLTDLPDGFFKNQWNLKLLELTGKTLKLRVSSFEGLKRLSELKFESVNLIQVEENVFPRLNIRKLWYNTENREHIFPIESLNSQETIEDLRIKGAKLSLQSENLGPTLRSMKQLTIIYLNRNSIGSVEAFVDLPNVEKIDLYKNKIELLPANAFKGCPRLSELELSFNNIKAIHPEAFNSLHTLSSLGLLGNKCIDHSYNQKSNVLDMTSVKNELRGCFENFSGQKTL
jgi:leucine-rich repeat-containing G protein-coupled receptor 6